MFRRLSWAPRVLSENVWEVGHSLSHSLCDTKNKMVKVNAKCDQSVAGSEAVPARGVGHSAPTGGPASRPSSMCKKAEQRARKGVKRRNRISFVPPFYGFLRLFTPYGLKIYFRRFNCPQTTADGLKDNGEECKMNPADENEVLPDWHRGRRELTVVTLKSAYCPRGANLKLKRGREGAGRMLAHRRCSARLTTHGLRARIHWVGPRYVLSETAYSQTEMRPNEPGSRVGRFP
jgi:hypothetical protein